jgi:hypothetical protein
MLNGAQPSVELPSVERSGVRGSDLLSQTEARRIARFLTAGFGRSRRSE